MSSSVAPAIAVVVADAEQPVLVQLEPEADGAIAQRDVVRLGAGEILHRGPAARGGDESQIGLEAALHQDARLRVAVAEHPLDEPVRDECVHESTPARRLRGCRCRRTSRSRGGGCRPARSSASGARDSRRSPTSAAATSCASGSSCRPACRLRSSSALRISASFFGPMPWSARTRPSAAARSRSSSVRMLELAVQHRDRLRARHPGGAADRGSSGETRPAARGETRRRRCRRSRGSSPRDPCRCRGFSRSPACVERRENSCG